MLAHRVVAAVQDKMKELAVPGVVLFDGNVSTGGFGVTNVDHPLPVTDDTLFQIGSISKTFTGTAILRLVEQGKLTLDDPIRRYLPGFAVKDAVATARATLRDTLTHMTGWEGDFFDSPSDGDDALQQIVERMATLEQTAKIGEIWSYNNAGFYVAGRVIEIVTGKPFEQAIDEWVFGPLGIEHAYFSPADVMTRRFAVGHDVSQGVATVLRPWRIPRAANAAGGIVTNVPTLLRYAAFHMGDGTGASGARVLSASSLNAMRSTVVTKAGTDETMGLTWHLSRVGELAVAEHGGGTIGQLSLLLLAPERGFALAVVTNSARGRPLITHVQRAAMDAYLGVSQPRPSPITTPPDTLADYAGHYHRQFTDVRVTVDGSGLKVEMTPKMPGLDGKIPPPPPTLRVAFHGKDHLMALDGPNAGERTGEFVRDVSGQVAWLRFGGRVHRRVQPASSATNR